MGLLSMVASLPSGRSWRPQFLASLSSAVWPLILEEARASSWTRWEGNREHMSRIHKVTGGRCQKAQ